MRLNSLLLDAVFFACLHTSSTRSMITSVNITEERTLNMPAIGESAKEISKELSEAEEEMMKLSSLERPPNRMKLDESLQLDNDDTSQLRDVYLQFGFQLQKYPLANELVTQVLIRLDDESAFKLIDALQKVNVKNEIPGSFKIMQIKHWKDQKKSPLNVFKLLKLDSISSLDTPTELERFKMWIKFLTVKSDRSIVDVCKDFPMDLVLMILDGLRLMKDTPNVKSMEAALVQLLLHRHRTDPSFNAFKFLKLDDGLEKLLTHPNLNLFYEYVGMATSESWKKRALLLEAGKAYGPLNLAKMLHASSQRDDGAEANLLLIELSTIQLNTFLQGL